MAQVHKHAVSCHVVMSLESRGFCGWWCLERASVDKTIQSVPGLMFLIVAVHRVFCCCRQLVKQNLKEQRADRFMRAAPLEPRARTCEPLLSQRFFPKWLETFKAAGVGGSKGTASVSCEVLHEPQY